MPKHKPELAAIYRVFGLSSNHELSTLLVNIENTKRFADLLHAVEREFFMIPGGHRKSQKTLISRSMTSA